MLKTWDVTKISVEEILGILPPKFKHFWIFTYFKKSIYIHQKQALYVLTFKMSFYKTWWEDRW